MNFYFVHTSAVIFHDLGVFQTGASDDTGGGIKNSGKHLFIADLLRFGITGVVCKNGRADNAVGIHAFDTVAQKKYFHKQTP